jgi:hypothetical protein
LYVLASVREDVQIEGAIDRFEAEELKFSKLATTTEGRELVITLLSGLTEDQTKTHLVDKRYMAIAKVVDEIVEPFAVDTGLDIYEGDSHIGLTKILWVSIVGFAGEESLNEFVRRFVELMRRRTSGAFEAFFEYVDSLSVLGDEIGNQMSFLNLVKDHAREQIVGAPKGFYELDPAVPSLMLLSYAWSDQLKKPHVFVHDEAGAIQRWKSYFLAFSREDIPPTVIQAGSRQISLPTLTRGLELVDSQSEPLVQVADLLAGATRYWATGLRDTGAQTDFWHAITAERPERFLSDVLAFVP